MLSHSTNVKGEAIVHMSKTTKLKVSLRGTPVSDVSKFDELFQDISSEWELKALRLRRRRWDRLQAME